MKKVFVTGGDGFLGSNLVEILIDRGYEISVLVQAGRSTGLLDALPVTQIEGDLLNREQMIDVTRGMDAIIHIAAVTDVWPSQGPIYWRVNVDGTQNIIDACLANDIGRMIHCSSASSFKFGSKANPGTEAKLTPRGHYRLDYIDSKQAGQELVIRATKEQQLRAIVVNPTFMIGPKDTKPSSGAFLVNACKGNMPALTNGGKNWVYVKDVAVAIANALTMGRIGESYILGHENLEYGDALSIISEISGCKLPSLKAPDFLIKLVGALGSLGGTLFKIRPKLSYPMARIAVEGHYFSPAKAVAELEMPQTPIRQAFAESYQWFIDHKYLP
ncbi:MAG: NAD-dependent epimerase/dehydratase family protein [Bacteroidia bacterium]|nr:NAD-dependent epimerase/dehydratase family protein [Bacteroidia bacterium]